MPKAEAATMPIVLPVADLSDEALRDMLKAGRGFRRDYPGEPWVFMAEHCLFALIRDFGTATRADERRRCLGACRGAKTASDARSRIRALPEETSTTKRKGTRTK